MASAALWKLRYHFEGDDIIHKEMVINPSHKLGHFRLWVKMHIIHLIQLLFQVSFYSRDFNFIFFFYLELNLCRKKKKEKDEKNPNQKWRFGLILDYECGCGRGFWPQRYLLPQWCPFLIPWSIPWAEPLHGRALALLIVACIWKLPLFYLQQPSYNWLSENKWFGSKQCLQWPCISDLTAFHLKARVDVSGCKDLTAHWPRSSWPFLIRTAWKLQMVVN